MQFGFGHRVFQSNQIGNFPYTKLGSCHNTEIFSIGLEYLDIFPGCAFYFLFRWAVQRFFKVDSLNRCNFIQHIIVWKRETNCPNQGAMMRKQSEEHDPAGCGQLAWAWARRMICEDFALSESLP